LSSVETIFKKNGIGETSDDWAGVRPSTEFFDLIYSVLNILYMFPSGMLFSFSTKLPQLAVVGHSLTRAKKL
jgi:hypothetical protein